MTNNTTQQKTGTVTINGRTYTHKTRNGLMLARRSDIYLGQVEKEGWFLISINKPEVERLEIYFIRGARDPSFNDEDDLCVIPATTTRPRELKDVVAELAKGGAPWVKYPDKLWFVTTNGMNELNVKIWNDRGVLFSTNPFKETPTIIYPEITEEVKP